MALGVPRPAQRNQLDELLDPGTVIDVSRQYDTLNRVTNQTDGVGPAACTYDPAGQLAAALGTGGQSAENYGYGWYQSGETRYVYDGMRVLQERNSSNRPQVTYPRGLDLSGSFEGAGGIGGLLARSHGYNSGLYNYGYRWYTPNTQRWTSRDPIGERGGINLYAFLGNGSPN